MEEHVQTLLNEATVTSFVIYLEDFKDRTSAEWVSETFAGYQTAAASAAPWEAWWLHVMKAEPFSVTVHQVLRQNQGGSGTNPYLKKDAVHKTWETVVDPFALTKRMLTLRETIANEWLNDLGLVEVANDEVLRFNAAKKTTAGFDGLPDDEADKLRALVFDYDPLGNNNTPLRGKSYKMLQSLTTELAVRRVLDELDNGVVRKPRHAAYLRRFVAEWEANGPSKPQSGLPPPPPPPPPSGEAPRRLDSPGPNVTVPDGMPIGNIPLGDAVAFSAVKAGQRNDGVAILEAMLETPPVLLADDIIEPDALARRIMQCRSDLAGDWIDDRSVLANVASAHMRLYAQRMEAALQDGALFTDENHVNLDKDGAELTVERELEMLRKDGEEGGGGLA